MPATCHPTNTRLSYGVARAALEGRPIFVLESDDLVGFRVRPDGTDMDIGSIETSDPGQKPVLGKVG